MSRRDRLHNSLRRALEHDGWTITADPLKLTWEEAELRIDMGAERTFAAEKDGQRIAIELKEFTAVSRVSALEKTIGQMQLYKWALEEQEPDRILLLAVSEAAYARHFERPLFQVVVRRNKMNVLIFRPETEEVLEWRMHNGMQNF